MGPGLDGVLAVRPPGTTRGRAARAPDGNETGKKASAYAKATARQDENEKIKPN